MTNNGRRQRAEWPRSRLSTGGPTLARTASARPSPGQASCSRQQQYMSSDRSQVQGQCSTSGYSPRAQRRHKRRRRSPFTAPVSQNLVETFPRNQAQPIAFSRAVKYSGARRCSTDERFARCPSAWKPSGFRRSADSGGCPDQNVSSLTVFHGVELVSPNVTPYARPAQFRRSCRHQWLFTTTSKVRAIDAAESFTQLK